MCGGGSAPRPRQTCRPKHPKTKNREAVDKFRSNSCIFLGCNPNPMAASRARGRTGNLRRQIPTYYAVGGDVHRTGISYIYITSITRTSFLSLVVLVLLILVRLVLVPVVVASKLAQSVHRPPMGCA